MKSLCLILTVLLLSAGVVFAEDAPAAIPGAGAAQFLYSGGAAYVIQPPTTGTTGELDALFIPGFDFLWIRVHPVQGRTGEFQQSSGGIDVQVSQEYHTVYLHTLSTTAMLYFDGGVPAVFDELAAWQNPYRRLSFIAVADEGGHINIGIWRSIQ